VSLTGDPWTTIDSTTLISGDVNILTVTDATDWPDSGLVRIGNEAVNYTYISYASRVGNVLQGCTYGLYGSPIYPHSVGAIVELGTYSVIPPLASDGVLPISLHMEAGGAPVRGEAPFSILIDGQKDPF
jgi:hypothetical protein